MASKVRPALLLTGHPADDELDLLTVLLQTSQSLECGICRKAHLRSEAAVGQALVTAETEGISRWLSADTTGKNVRPRPVQMDWKTPVLGVLKTAKVSI